MRLAMDRFSRLRTGRVNETESGLSFVIEPVREVPYGEPFLDLYITDVIHGDFRGRHPGQVVSVHEQRHRQAPYVDQ